MKKISFALAALLVFSAAFAQREDEQPRSHSFKQENIFIGGSLALGYGGGSGGSNFVVGINPEIGYTITEWLDAGLAFNCIYNSYRYTDYYDYKQTAFNYGGGMFLRIYPINQIFIQAQPEYNWIDYKVTTPNGPYPPYKAKVSAFSFIAGIGYGQRVVGHMNSFVLLGIDLANNKNSPYRDNYNNIIPVIRGGLNFYLRPKRQK